MRKTVSHRISELFKEHQALAAILVIGFLLRISGIFWGIPFPDPFEGDYHPDERVIIKGAVEFPGHILTNIKFYYPTFFHYFLGIITFPLRMFFDDFGVPKHGELGSNYYYVVTVIGRLCSVLAGTGTVFLTYLLAKDIYNKRRAVLASAFLAVTFYHANNSSFVTTDVFTSFFLVLFLLVLRQAFLTPETTSLFVLSGIILGLLVGTKYTGAIVSLAIVVMYVYTLVQQSRNQKERGHLDHRKLHLNLLLCGSAALVTFFLTTPGIFLHFNALIDSILLERKGLVQHSMPRSDLGAWIDAFQITGLAVGFPLACVFIFGLFFPYKKNVYEMSYIVILAAFFVYFEAALVSRYVILVAPLMAIIASHGVWGVYDCRGKAFKILGASTMVFVVVYSFGRCLEGAYERLNDTRTQAAHFLHDNIPVGTTIGVGYTSKEYQKDMSWKRPKINFTRYQQVDFLDFPEFVIVTDNDFFHIEETLNSGKISRDYILDEQYRKEWWEFSPPSPRIFQFYDELLDRERSKYELIAKYERPEDIFNLGEPRGPLSGFTVFGSPEVRIYRASSEIRNFEEERALLSSRIGMYYPPYTKFKSFYSNNPRQYFQKEDIRKWKWQLQVQEGNEADLVFPLEYPGRVRIGITQADTNIPWHIQLNQPSLAVQATNQYAVRFRARADQPRPMAVSVSQAHDPWESLGLYQEVALTSEWQSYDVEFIATGDDDNARVHFDMGGSPVSLEIAAAILHNIPWRLEVQEGSEAKLVFPPEHPKRMRIGITQADTNIPWHIQLNHPSLGVQATHRYAVRFRARADQPRPMTVAVGQAHDPWESLGLYQEVALTSEWQSYEVEFVATGDDDNARVYFDMGGSAVPVEMTVATLHSKSEAMSGDQSSSRNSLSGVSSMHRDSQESTLVEPDLPDQYYVEYQFNALGCRGRDYLIPRPKGGRRLLILGDSYALGAGVHEADTLASQLEHILNQERPRKIFRTGYEVINCGVGGYGIRDERIFYETLVSKYQPDVILLMVTPDDDQSWSTDGKRSGFDHLGKNPNQFVSWSNHNETLFDRSSPDYSASLQEVSRLHQLVQARGGRLAVVAFRNTRHRAWSPLVQQITEALQGTAVPVLDLGKALFKTHSEENLIVHKADKHPNEIAHEIAAQAIHGFLDKEGFLSRSAVINF